MKWVKHRPISLLLGCFFYELKCGENGSRSTARGLIVCAAENCNCDVINHFVSLIKLTCGEQYSSYYLI